MTKKREYTDEYLNDCIDTFALVHDGVDLTEIDNETKTGWWHYIGQAFQGGSVYLGCLDFRENPIWLHFLPHVSLDEDGDAYIHMVPHIGEYMEEDGWIDADEIIKKEMESLYYDVIEDDDYGYDAQLDYNDLYHSRHKYPEYSRCEKQFTYFMAENPKTYYHVLHEALRIMDVFRWEKNLKKYQQRLEYGRCYA